MAWYYALNGVRKGPVSEADFEALVETGEVPPDTLVWRPGMPDWIPLQLALDETAGPAAPPPDESGAPKRITTTQNRIGPPKRITTAQNPLGAPKRITTAQTQVAAPARITTSQTLARIGTARVHASSPAATYDIPHPFEFHGKASEYFRIWIVNQVLSFFTLGIYAAWAKVRTRAYFLGNTVVDGFPFEYQGNPAALLKGHLVVFGVAAGLATLAAFQPVLSFAAAILGLLVCPWLLQKSCQHRARHTSYRDVRFDFHATGMESYVLAFGLPLLVPLTGGLILPYFWFLRRKYWLGNLGYGNSRFYFNGELKWYYFFLLKVLGLVVVMFGLATLLAVAITLATQGSPRDLLPSPSMEFRDVPIHPLWLLYPASLLFLPAYFQSRITNYTLSCTMIGAKTRFASHLRARDLLWLQTTNFLLIILSLGLATPLAKIRNARYRATRTSLIVQGALGDVAVGATPPPTSLGQTLGDVMGFEIGL